jgi:hypothetical protein
MEKNSITLKEARGKTVQNMRVSFDPDYNCVEVEFTDGTCTAVDVVSAVKIRAQYQNIGTGNTRIIKTYRARMSVAGEF